jgi:predicted PurR-regulated permease PerM
MLFLTYLMSKINNQHIRQISFYVLLVFLGIFLFLQVSSFLPALLGAITFYILLRSPMHKMVYQKKWKKSYAASLLLLLSFLIVLVPVGIFLNMLSVKLNYVINNSNQVLETFHKLISTQEQQYHIVIFSDENVKKISNSIANFLPSILGATISSITTVTILYFILYFMLIGSKEMEFWLEENIPMKNKNVDLLGIELKKLVISNAVGIPLTAIVQGVIALIGYWVAGVTDLGFWFVFTCITSMVPVIGAGIAYIPICAMLYANGHANSAIILMLYCIFIVGTADHVFRFALQKKLGDIHPLITIFGVIVGLQLFGFIGLIFGPILIALFILLIRIYLNEFSTENRTT